MNEILQFKGRKLSREIAIFTQLKKWHKPC